jgi:hypothetical protein
MRRFSATAALLLLIGFAVSDTAALVRYDFEQPMFSEPPQPILDHCVVEQGGLYHLFYLRGNPAVNIGHATTTDFVHWNILPPVLSPGTWDQKLWAPHLIKNDAGWWFMYYTGVNAPGAQQSGLAFSSDLAAWFKWPQPVYHPDPSWALWSESVFSHGRDPHVIQYNGLYYMFVTAKHQWNKGAVACATSPDLFNWTDAGYIYLHDSWHVLESVFIMQRNGLWHMFFTEEAVYGTSHMSSPTLYGGWNLIDRRIIDPGHAPQVTATTSGDILSRHSVYNDLHGGIRYVHRFSPLVWINDLPVASKPYPLLSEWTFVSGDAFNYQPTYLNNAYVRNENYPANFVGDGWINTLESYTGPMGFGWAGGFQGDVKQGVIRSATFSVQGNSFNLLVGGGNYPDSCYVALRDANTGAFLFRETGRNSNVMDRRYWDVRPHIGRSVYIEIADQSTALFGHICVDDIVESGDVVGNGSGSGTGTGKRTVSGGETASEETAAIARARLLPNAPNPFNPSTTLAYEVPSASRVRIDVFDASGARVRTLVDAARAAGRHTVEWDGRDHAGLAVSSGVYFARLIVGGAVVETRKLALLK